MQKHVKGIIIFVTGVLLGVLSFGIAGRGNEADLRQRASQYLTDLRTAQGKLSDLTTALERERGDATELRARIEGLSAENQRLVGEVGSLGKELDSVKKPIEGSLTGIDRIESIVRAVQGRGPVKN